MTFILLTDSNNLILTGPDYKACNNRCVTQVVVCSCPVQRVEVAGGWEAEDAMTWSENERRRNREREREKGRERVGERERHSLKATMARMMVMPMDTQETHRAFLR